MSLPIVDMVESQIITAIKKPELIEKAIQSKSNIAFLLTGDLFTMSDYVAQLKKANMYTFLHIDLVEGIANDKCAVQYIAREWKPDGIITTRPNLIRVAKEEGLKTIQRVFLLDQSAYKKGIEMIRSCEPDAIEILPGVIPKIIYDITENLKWPVIAGGLISDKQDILDALQAGALATSISTPSLWDLEL